MQTTYQTIAQEASCEFKDRGSRFIAYSFVVRTYRGCEKTTSNIKRIAS
jgi:hypothetical protein